MAGSMVEVPGQSMASRASSVSAGPSGRPCSSQVPDPAKRFTGSGTTIEAQP
jgi:hypothetical protein